MKAGAALGPSHYRPKPQVDASAHKTLPTAGPRRLIHTLRSQKPFFQNLSWMPRSGLRGDMRLPPPFALWGQCRGSGMIALAGAPPWRCLFRVGCSFRLPGCRAQSRMSPVHNGDPAPGPRIRLPVYGPCHPAPRGMVRLPPPRRMAEPRRLARGSGPPGTCAARVSQDMAGGWHPRACGGTACLKHRPAGTSCRAVLHSTLGLPMHAYPVVSTVWV